MGYLGAPGVKPYHHHPAKALIPIGKQEWVGKGNRPGEEAQLLHPAATTQRCHSSRVWEESNALTWGWRRPALVPKVLVRLPSEFKAPALWPRRRLANPNPVLSRSRRPHPPGPTPCQESGQTRSWELTSLPVPGTSPSHRRALSSPPAGISQREIARGRGRPRPGARWLGLGTVTQRSQLILYIPCWARLGLEVGVDGKKMLLFLLSLGKGDVWGRSVWSCFKLFLAYFLHPRADMKLSHPSPLLKERQLPLCHGQVRLRLCVEQKMASFKSGE